eukprot:4336041-Pyramimonas_sp.AAC.1
MRIIIATVVVAIVVRPARHLRRRRLPPTPAHPPRPLPSRAPPTSASRAARPVRAGAASYVN